MKKIFYGALILCLTFVLTGCDFSFSFNKDKEETVTCKQSQEGVDVYMYVNVKGEHVTGMSFKYEMDLSSYTDEQINLVQQNDFCTIVKSSLSQYANGFADCNYGINDDKVLVVDAKLDVNNIDGMDEKTNSKEIKDGFEKQNYICEIS